MSLHSLLFTPLKEIKQIHAKVTNAFHKGTTIPLAYRRRQLLQLARMIKDNRTAMEDTVLNDLGRSRIETAMIELIPIFSAALHAVDHLEAWAAPEKPQVAEAWRKSWEATIYKAPKGAVLNIAPWNHPHILTLSPLVGAIAAGCTCVIKPSELAPATARFLAELIPEYLDTDAYDVVNGGIEEATELINCQWDHILYTGSSRVGRIVASIAGRNLTPVTLELGGKSPVIIDDDCDLDIAARRILFGKAQNSGQLCVSPDYVLVSRSRMDALVEAFKKAHVAFWPKGVFDAETAWGRIVNPESHARIKGMVDNTKGEIVIGGSYEGDQRVALTIIKNVLLDDPLMQAEIFGPLLPLVPVDGIDRAIKTIQKGKEGSPLAIYAFTENKTIQQKLLDHTHSGALVFNDTTSYLAVLELPLGGVGNSGYGSWGGKHTFDAFTHRRCSINVPYRDEPLLAGRYPPYTKEDYDLACRRFDVAVPVV